MASEKLVESLRLVDSETQTEIGGKPMSENELSKDSLDRDDLRRRKSNRRNRSESDNENTIVEVMEEKPGFHEYTGLRLGSICALV